MQVKPTDPDMRTFNQFNDNLLTRYASQHRRYHRACADRRVTARVRVRISARVRVRVRLRVRIRVIRVRVRWEPH